MSDDICRNNHGGDDNSEKANKRTNKARGRMLVLAEVGRHGNATCDELEIWTGLSHQTCSARVSELRRDGVLIPTGGMRPTRTGSPAAVLVIRQQAGKPEPEQDSLFEWGEKEVEYPD